MGVEGPSPHPALAPAKAPDRPHRDRDGLLAASWRQPFRPGSWLSASLTPAPCTRPHCVQVANAFSPTLLRGLEKGWDSGGGRRRPCAPSIFLLPLWPDSAPPPPVGCYVTDTGGSQAAQHRSTAAYTIAHQTVTVFITQVRSNCLPSHPASILATPTQDSWPQHC